MFRRKVSRSELICSIVMEAMTRRSCPKMMSFARSAISSWEIPSRRFAAFPISELSVLTPTVKTDGTLIRIFCLHSAPDRLTSIWSGRSERKP